MSIKQFISDSKKQGPIKKFIDTSVQCLFFSLLVSIILYFAFSRYIYNQNYGFYVLLSVLSYSIIIPAVNHAKSYKSINSMSGMMVGMTIGMISGFLPGFIIGATSGMFYGAVFGMALGIFLGVWNGRCCGIMGVMEGIMAGFMGGLMGAMTSVMTLNDHVKILGIIIYIISLVIVLGLNYMLYSEVKSSKSTQNYISQSQSIFWSVFLTVLTIIIIYMGPRSFLFQ